MTIGIDTVWLQLLSIPDIVSCIAFHILHVGNLSWRSVEHYGIGSRIKGGPTKCKKNNNKHNNKQWATVQKCTKIDYGMQTKSKNYQGGYMGRHGMPEAINKWQCSPLQSVQMTLVVFNYINILSYLWCFMCLDTHTMEEMSLGACSMAWVTYVCQYLLINQPGGAPRKGEKSKKCKNSCKIQYKKAKRVSKGCNKSKKIDKAISTEGKTTQHAGCHQQGMV